MREPLALHWRQAITSVRNERRQFDLDTILDRRASRLEETAVLRKQITAAGLAVIRAGTGRILQRGELVLTRDLKHCKALRVREHVKDEHFKLHAVRRGRLDGCAAGQLDVRDLLARNVECEVVFECSDAAQERGAVEVVRDVACAEEQLACCSVARCGLRGGDL